MLKYLIICVSIIALSNANAILEVNSVSFQKKSVSTLSGINGVVSPAECGGNGEHLQLRVDDCEGELCHFTGGEDYGFEVDFVPAQSSSGLSLRLTVVLTGIDVPVLDVAVPGSEVEAGNPYTIAYFVTANDLLSGNEIGLKLEIYHTTETDLEICVTVPAIIHHSK